MRIQLLEQKLQLQEEFSSKSTAIVDTHERFIDKWIAKTIDISSKVRSEEQSKTLVQQVPPTPSATAPTFPIPVSNIGVGSNGSSSSVLLLTSPLVSLPPPTPQNPVVPPNDGGTHQSSSSKKKKDKKKKDKAKKKRDKQKRKKKEKRKKEKAFRASSSAHESTPRCIDQQTEVLRQLTAQLLQSLPSSIPTMSAANTARDSSVHKGKRKRRRRSSSSSSSSSAEE